jgi:hypothetical protein
MNDLFDVDAPLDVPLCPPKSWFEEVPDSFDPRDGLIQIALSGEDEGRVVALVAPEGERILRDDIEFQTPQSPTNYEFAHAGTTITAEGEKIRTANVGGNINHAPVGFAMRAAVDLYANTATRTIRCRYHDVPGVGVVAVGAMWPGLTKRDAITAMGMAISGDWRHVASLGARDLAGSQLVNAPALRPLPHGVERAPSYRPMRFVPVAAGLGGGDDVVFGDWVTDDGVSGLGLPSRSATADVVSVGTVPVNGPTVDTASTAPPVSDFERRLAAVEAVVSVLIAEEVREEVIDGDDSDLADLFRSHFGCEACQGTGDGCPRCGGTGIEPYHPSADVGFDVSDEFPDGVPDGDYDPDDPDDDDDDDDDEDVVDVPMYGGAR